MATLPDIKCKFCDGTGKDEEDAALPCPRCRGEGIEFCEGCACDSGDESEPATRRIEHPRDNEGVDEMFLCARHAKRYDDHVAWESRGDYERDMRKHGDL